MVSGLTLPDNMDSIKDEKNINPHDTQVLPSNQHVVDTTRAEADLELAATHEGEFGTKRDLVSVPLEAC